jgi:hypothetical protein
MFPPNLADAPTTSVIYLHEMEHNPTGAKDAFCLAFHAGYACRSAGACCTAGWTIPVEKRVYETLVVHFGPKAPAQQLFARGPMPDGAAAVLERTAAGDCVFFEADKGRLCAIHRELGPSLLPAACRQFPRVVLDDARGMMISLSHFCPTAAALLMDPSLPQIVRAPASLAIDGLEGLDARGVMPPLLRHGMLTDMDGYDAWERSSIALLGRTGVTAAQAVAAIAEATSVIQSWRPGGISLRQLVERELHVASGAEADEDLDADERRARLAWSSVPEGLAAPGPFEAFRSTWPDVAKWWKGIDAIVRRYLASRLFGNWIAYYGAGLHDVVEYLRITLSVLKMEAARAHARSSPSSSPWQTLNEAVRNADLLLVHLSDTRRLVDLLPSRRPSSSGS